ncbi:glycosyltransferase family 4 protein [Archangium sp.]|uniref:glycosyltransferase family 4 protein n=1 Tax=Archangium sp. TaxID=1872627 RepID=UPI003899AF27
MALVIHPHFHNRRTGVTRHVETVVPVLSQWMETLTIGSALEGDLPRIGWRALWNRVRREPVIWHAHRNNELIVGLLLKLFGRQVKVVFTRHASMQPRPFTRLLAGRAHRLISLTPQVAEVMRLPSTIIAHGVDLTRFAPSPERSAAWSRLGLSGRYGIGVIGRVRPAKGQGDFVEAIAPLLSKYPEWHPLLVGLVKSGERDWADQLRASTGGALSLVGEQSDVVPWYQGLSVLVHPSYTEGFSLVHVEALATGCCVVASRLPYLPDIIEHGRTGFLFEPGDVKGLRDILDMLMAEPERALAVGRNAAEEARRRFGIEHEARALADLYETLL